MINCLCLTFYHVWYTVGKVVHLKQREFYSCIWERPQCSHDLVRAEMQLTLLSC